MTANRPVRRKLPKCRFLVSRVPARLKGVLVSPSYCLQLVGNPEQCEGLLLKGGGANILVESHLGAFYPCFVLGERLQVVKKSLETAGGFTSLGSLQANLLLSSRRALCFGYDGGAACLTPGRIVVSQTALG